MNLVKQHTQALHDLAEKTDFSQNLISGTVTGFQYLCYLHSKWLICSQLENKLTPWPHSDLKRSMALRQDIIEVDPRFCVRYFTSPAVAYSQYISRLPNELLAPHVYVHYLGDLYGGQMIAKNLRLPCRHLHFNNRAQCITSIREIQVEETWFADEASKAFEWVIKIYEHIG